jgi:putative chitinase
MPITEQQLLQIMPNAGPRAGVFVPVLNAAMKRWQITTPRRMAAFLAQIGHESSQLRNTRELWGPTPAQARYDLRTDLGNTPQADGDGRRYLGRGLIQITGRANYAAVSIALFGDDRLLKTPELLEQPEWAAESAGWFWWVKELNSLADQGRFADITRRINGGLNGQKERLVLWSRATEVLA